MESSLSIAAFIVGMTQLVKSTGLVKGNWLRFVSVAFGAFAAYMFQYEPELWLGFSEIWIALSATGLVALGKEFKKK